MNPFLTVIIPTYNRKEQLENCLDKLKEQSLAKSSYEVIVVNDGSTDGTEEMLNKRKEIKALKQENAGQGIARNLAIPHARGQIIVFIGDDIYPTKTFLEEHSKFHKENPQIEYACLGLTLWDRDLKQNDFMQWLTEGGPQFAYHKLKRGEEASFWFFYTSNISLKSKLLHRQPFDPDFKGYGWEDIEIAYRIKKKEGLKIIYRPEALTYHDHYMEEKSLKKKMFKIGKNANVFQMKHPELKIVPKGFKKILLKVISSIPVIFLFGILRILIPSYGRRLYWYVLSKRYFLKGLSSV